MSYLTARSDLFRPDRSPRVLNKEHSNSAVVSGGCCLTFPRACGAGRKPRSAAGGWAANHTSTQHDATLRASVGSARYPQPDKRKTHPAAAQPHTTLCAGAEADMTQQGATLQNYNNELVKCTHRPPTYSATVRPPIAPHAFMLSDGRPLAGIEDLREKREEVNRSIAKDEEEKGAGSPRCGSC